MIIRQRDKEFKTDGKFKSKSIVQLNNEAVNALKSGDDIEAIAKYAKVFRKAHENGVDARVDARVARIRRWRI